MRSFLSALVTLVGCLPVIAPASTYPLPYQAFDLVGNPQIVEADHEDTLLDIARRYDVGQTQIVLANPGVDRWLPGAGSRIVIPSHHILPPVPKEGLVLNLPEMRLYFYPQSSTDKPDQVQTYPVSIGRMDWATPLGKTTLVSKQKNPAWRPPQSIRQEHAEAGDPLPAIVPPGPDNPLGDYAMRLGIPGYLIHGTNKVFGVGMRVSHGCVRMLPEDIEALFPQVATGTTVRIINQPAKVGWYGGALYLEVHPPLEEDLATRAALTETIMELVDEALFRRPAELDLVALEQAIALRTGMPRVISAEP
jgi:L,D-transpeptidase ErfK/SrfK